MADLLREREKLLKAAYFDLSTPNRSLHAIDRNSFRDLALRHVFAILPRRTLPSSMEDWHSESRDLGASFLKRYGVDIWPDDYRAAGGFLFEQVVKYFYQLLQLPAQAPEDELLEGVTVKKPELIEQQKREEKKRMEDAKEKEGQYTMSRRKSCSDLPSPPKPEWTGKTEAEVQAADALIAEGNDWHMGAEDNGEGKGEGSGEEEEKDADAARPGLGRKGSPEEGLIEIHKDLANLSIGGEESGSVCTVPLDVQSTPCGEVFDTVGELKEHLEEVHGLTDAVRW